MTASVVRVIDDSSRILALSRRNWVSVSIINCSVTGSEKKFLTPRNTCCAINYYCFAFTCVYFTPWEGYKENPHDTCRALVIPFLDINQLEEFRFLAKPSPESPKMKRLIKLSTYIAISFLIRIFGIDRYYALIINRLSCNYSESIVVACPVKNMLKTF